MRRGFLSKKAFFEKDDQKAFASADAELSVSSASADKSFLLLFLEKEGLAFLWGRLGGLPHRAASQYGPYMFPVTAAPW
jgi:hypothetical protein